MLDLKLPGMGGLDVLRQLKARAGNIKVIMLTAHGSVQTAVEAVKLRAYEYLAKPVVLSELKRVIDRAATRNARPSPSPTTGFAPHHTGPAGAAWPGNVRELRNALEQVVMFH